MAVLEVQSLQKVVSNSFLNNKTSLLKDINFKVEQGEYIAILGESGSGKSTLLQILGLMDSVDNGKIILDGYNITRLEEDQIPAFRRTHFGMIFPDFRLIDTLTVQENICFPMVMDKQKPKEMIRKCNQLLEFFNLKNELNLYPHELRDELKQRCALARALIMQPDFILADEPTWRLKSRETDAFLDLLDQVHKRPQTILITTHSALVASRADRVLFIRDGRIHKEMKRQGSSKDFYIQLARTFEKIHMEDAYGH